MLHLFSLMRRGRQGEGVALIGIILLAGGLAVLAGSALILARALITGGLWLAAIVLFGLART